MGWVQDNAPTPTFDFNIPQQRADLALTEFAEQADLTLIVPHELVQDIEANKLVGRYSLENGVEVLLAGTGLKPSFSNHVVLSVSAEEPIDEGEPMDIKKKVGILATIASVFGGVATAQETGDERAAEDTAPMALEEIIVTGTSIRGVTNPASPVISFDREDILNSGFANLADFVQTIPQNFNGGFTDVTGNVPGAAGANGNFSAGTGIDLRGLGADSTLVLLNGRRLAPAGVGRFTDVSTIPASAIERIEIVLDGASAIYGSDAVGGVVNIILREDFEGAETTVRYGTVTDGAHEAWHATQAFGSDWNSGGFFGNYEFSSQKPLQSTDRSYTEQSPFPYDLTSDLKQHNVFLSASQDVFRGGSVFATANYSTRDAFGNLTSVSFPSSRESETDQYGGVLGLEWNLPGSWLAEFSTGFNRYESTTLQVLPIFDLRITQEFESEVWSWDAKADGDLFDLPGGPAKLAVGIGTRKEEFQSAGADREARDVGYLYSESILPIVGPDNSIAGVNSLELSAAIRYEDYEDIGSSTDGKVGIVWSLTQGLQVRGTYGTSFRAPLLFEAAPLPGITTVRDSVDPQSPTGTTPGMFLLGNALSTAAPELGTPLEPEESEMFTIGLDFRPDFWPGFSASLSYFDIDFTDRISAPGAVSSNVLLDPAYLPVIVFDPTPTQVADAIAASDNFANFTDIPDEDLTTSGIIGFIYDGRTANIATTANSGFDLQLAYSREVAKGTFGLTISGTYLTELQDRITSTAAPLDRLDTFQNPIDLRLRAGLSWSQDQLSTNLFLNYADSYRDDRQDPEASIGSFTTVDWTISYEFARGGAPSPLDNVRLLFSAVNVLNENPPFVDNPLGLNANFDARNASPLGRVLALQVSKHWLGK